MNSILTFDFAIDKENKKVAVVREFAAERALVWDAFTKKEILDQWWAPKPWKAQTKTMEFKEGGSRVYAMVGPEGEEHWAIIEFKTIEKLKRFTAMDAFTDANGVKNKEMPQIQWDVKFTDKKEGTLVAIILSFDQLSDLETIISMGFQEGFTIALQGLDEVLASLQGK